MEYNKYAWLQELFLTFFEKLEVYLKQATDNKFSLINHNVGKDYVTVSNLRGALEVWFIHSEARPDEWLMEWIIKQGKFGLPPCVGSQF